MPPTPPAPASTPESNPKLARRQRLQKIIRAIFFACLVATVAFALFSLVRIFILMN